MFTFLRQGPHPKAGGLGNLTKIFPILPMDIRPNVEKPFYERCILGDTAHVQNVLPIILLTMNGRSFSKYKNIVLKYNIVLYFTILFLYYIFTSDR